MHNDNKLYLNQFFSFYCGFIQEICFTRYVVADCTNDVTDSLCSIYYLGMYNIVIQDSLAFVLVFATNCSYWLSGCRFNLIGENLIIYLLIEFNSQITNNGAHSVYESQKNLIKNTLVVILWTPDLASKKVCFKFSLIW